MRLIDRLYQYLENKNLTAYAFERACGIANGYLKKQFNGKGTLGSEILDKIHSRYPELNTVWLLTGEGEMLIGDSGVKMLEIDKEYLTIKDEIIDLLKNQISVLEENLADKEKIIQLLEKNLLPERTGKTKTGDAPS